MPGEFKYAAVLVDAGGPAARRPFDYSVPPDLTADVHPGSLVVVPFGRRFLRGLVTAMLAQPAVPSPKPIRSLLSSAGLADHRAGEMAQFVAGRYAASPIEAYRAILPAAIAGHTTRTWVHGDADPPTPGSLPPDLDAVYGLVRVGDGVTLHQVAEALEISSELALKRLRRLSSLRLAAPAAHHRPSPRRIPTVLYAAAPGADPSALSARAVRQAAVLRAILASGSPVALSELPGPPAAARQAVNTLLAKGLVLAVPSPGSGRSAPQSLAGPMRIAQLTAAQEMALDRIAGSFRAGGYHEYLLWGVTGSGKTEVYLRAIEQVLASGRQALVLVPEIALTPQAAARFDQRFPGRVALLHSRLAGGERTQAWLDLRQGRARVALGPRSAVFAPLDNLGLVVVDEEHESSYKQEDIPRYDAREVARFRAQSSSCVLVWGSATPSLEAYARATERGVKEPGMDLLVLPERVDRLAMPVVRLVDMRVELAGGNRTVFSRILRDEMAERLERGQQTVLFLNRRGLATFVLCRECGHVVRCPDCDVSLVYHGHEQAMRCHYCGHSAQPPATCPACGGIRIRYFGAGTERVEAQARELLPGARIARLDSDVAGKRGKVEAILDGFARGEIDILVGTQMVVKGMDIPGVTLVGVIAADAALGLPDFRASERTFGLVTQVAGRAGRGPAGGLVLVQTYNPEHYSLQFAQRHDYAGFAARELEYRLAAGYPPFTHLAMVRLSGHDENAVAAAAAAAGRLLRDLAAQTAASGPRRTPQLEILGPAPAPLHRLQGRYRWHIVIKDVSVTTLAGFCARALDELDRESGPSVRVSVDVDPQSLM